MSLFLIGSLGTTVGVLLGMWVINGPESIGPLYYAMGGMFVGTYTGGSINFNALALAYDVVKEGVLFGGAVVVDNILTTVWMIITLAIPRLLAPFWPTSSTASTNDRSPDLGIENRHRKSSSRRPGTYPGHGFWCLACVQLSFRISPLRLGIKSLLSFLLLYWRLS